MPQKKQSKVVPFISFFRSLTYHAHISLEHLAISVHVLHGLLTAADGGAKDVLGASVEALQSDKQLIGSVLGLKSTLVERNTRARNTVRLARPASRVSPSTACLTRTNRRAWEDEEERGGISLFFGWCERGGSAARALAYTPSRCIRASLSLL